MRADVSPTPWHLSKGGWNVVSPRGVVGFVHSQSLDGDGPRIVACVNALAGLDLTPATVALLRAVAGMSEGERGVLADWMKEKGLMGMEQ